jgi:uncharacterized membrane protein
VPTSRLEAFSDGVFAIAITLLVLDIRVPKDPPDGLARALVDQWPNYAAYVVSFLIIGIIWVNHHATFQNVRRVDRPLLFVNLALLLVVAAIPFPTALLAEYLLSSDGAHVAAAVYSAVMLAMSICFVALWAYLARRPELLDGSVGASVARERLRRSSLGIVVYPFTIALAFVSAPLTLAVHFGIALFYVFERVSLEADGSPNQPG